jgi:circadian clock protein KaiC
VLKKRTGWHEQTIRELKLDAKGISISEPLREFTGVLTGSPAFSSASLFQRQAEQ